MPPRITGGITHSSISGVFEGNCVVMHLSNNAYHFSDSEFCLGMVSVYTVHVRWVSALQGQKRKKKKTNSNNPTPLCFFWVMCSLYIYIWVFLLEDMHIYAFFFNWKTLIEKIHSPMKGDTCFLHPVNHEGYNRVRKIEIAKRTAQITTGNT